MGRKCSFIIPIIFACFLAGIFSSCDQQDNKLIVYSGKGMKKVMEEIKQNFEDTYDLRLNIIYAGSKTLLTTLKNTESGDVYIPGSVSFIEQASDLVLHHQYVSLHVPAFAVRKDNPKNIQSFEDLLNPGVEIAIGNKNMCAIGRISTEIIQSFSEYEKFSQKISIIGTTVNELLDLLFHQEADASLIWKDMLQWPVAQDLQLIEIPPDLNKPQKIHIAVLSTTTDRKSATLFADFVATEGKDVFAKYGFGEE